MPLLKAHEAGAAEVYFRDFTISDYHACLSLPTADINIWAAKDIDITLAGATLCVYMHNNISSIKLGS